MQLYRKMVLSTLLKLEHSNKIGRTRSIAITAMLLAILIIQEELLMFLPNVQLTTILIVVYAQFLSDRELYPLVMIYVLIDNMYMGSFNLLYTPAMFFSWLLLAFIAKKLKNNSDTTKFILVILFAFIYGFSFIPATALIQHFNWSQTLKYIKFDIPFEIIMAVSNIVAFFVVYRPLTVLLKEIYNNKQNNIFKL